MAQTNSSSISGRVINEHQQPVEAATIVLLNQKDSTVAASAITGKTGGFQIAGLRSGNYLLLVSAVGFIKAYSKSYPLSLSKALITDDVILKADSRQLKEVQVVSSKPPIEVRPGKVILNVQNSIMADGNSVFEILKQSPGVRVDVSNTISVVGRQSALIMVDGKPTNLSGEDLIDFLKTIQSSTIDRIELITSGSARYDAAGAGVVNIILKKGKNIGFNGSATATAGYGTYYKSNAGVNFNNRTDKLNVFGNYTLRNDESFISKKQNRDVDYNDLLSVLVTDYYSKRKIISNSFNAGADYFISPNHTIGVLIKGNFQHNPVQKNINLKVYNQSKLDSTVVANSVIDKNITQMNYNLNYTGKINKAGGTLSANVDYNTFVRSSNEYITNRFYNSTGDIFRPDSLLRNLSPAHIKVWTSKIDFVNPLSKVLTLQAGAKYSNVKSDNNLNFGPLVNGVYQTDPSFSNHFIYHENVNAAYLNFENKGDKVEWTAGLRAEQTVTEGNSITSHQVIKNNYLNFFPNALLVYKLNAKHNFSLSYNRGISRPSYSFLNPFRIFIDLYDYDDAGNPNLRPQYTNNLELSYTYKDVITATLFSNTVSNAYEFPLYQQNDTTKLFNTRKVNLGNVYNYGMRFYAPAEFTAWWKADFNVTASYVRYVVNPIYTTFKQGSQDIMLSADQHFTITKTIRAELSGFYESPVVNGLDRLKSYGYVNAGLSMQLWNNSGSIRLNAADIFNTNNFRNRVKYANISFYQVAKEETRMVRVTFTYKFGKSTVKAAKTHQTGNEEELKRTTGG
ncbi:TonB-dependent receptor [Mucilaginibacter sp. CSA2-8R]|uniref:TonB-dependent receptor n=1 Tax=Mucilaginibacter sp. CSA2-8R TaxID=3141542 RepID=UPI00315CFACD